MAMHVTYRPGRNQMVIDHTDGTRTTHDIVDEDVDADGFVGRAYCADGREFVNSGDHGRDDWGGGRKLDKPPTYVDQARARAVPIRYRLGGSTEPVGLLEIADRLGVEPQTARNWRTRGVLPPAEYTVSGSPAWSWGVIEAWAIETGRLAR